MSTTPAAPKPGEHAAPAKRLSLSQVLEKLLERGGGEHSSVTLSRNAKGETQIEVVVRTAETGDVQTIDQVQAKARELYDDLRTAYPFGAAPTNGEPS